MVNYENFDIFLINVLIFWEKDILSKKHNYVEIINKFIENNF